MNTKSPGRLAAGFLAAMALIAATIALGSSGRDDPAMAPSDAETSRAVEGRRLRLPGGIHSWGRTCRIPKNTAWWCSAAA